MSLDQRQRRASIAARARHAPDDPQTDARRDLRAANLEQHVRRIVDQAPPLTDEQRNKIAALLRPSPDSGGGRAA